MNRSNEWLKNKGYIHLTPQIDIVSRRHEIINKVTDVNYVKTYAFFPLVHSSIKERRFKKARNQEEKSHSYKDETGKTVRNAKERPLHYSCHMDSLIFGYYASILQSKYELKLKEDKQLSNAIIAYRRIPLPNSSANKSTIHFAKEVFDEIESRVNKFEECSVLMFDIKSFFSRINHSILKDAWEKLLNESSLPPDHRNIFNATTKFSYVLYNDLRLKTKSNKSLGLDEGSLSRIRKSGKHSFFESAADFRNAIKNKVIRLYRFPFRDENKNPIGIPQGLAISAVLANLYLFDFDKKICNEIVNLKSGFYRRYSDDILIICKPSEVSSIKQFVTTAIEENKVEISRDKTEEYLFQSRFVNKISKRIISIKIKSDYCQIGAPLTYLGFEFYGDKVLIKSTNLSKFYRRMVYSIKSKAKHAKIKSGKSPHNTFALYRRQLYKLYILHDLNESKIRSNVNKLVKNEKGYYEFDVKPIERKFKSNYLTYINRVCEIMRDDSPLKQIRKHRKIFNESISRHLHKQRVRD